MQPHTFAQGGGGQSASLLQYGGGGGGGQSGNTVWHCAVVGSHQLLAHTDEPSGHCLHTWTTAQSPSDLHCGGGGGEQVGHFTSHWPLSQTAIGHETDPSGHCMQATPAGATQSLSQVQAGGGGHLGTSS